MRTSLCRYIVHSPCLTFLQGIQTSICCVRIFLVHCVVKVPLSSVCLSRAAMLLQPLTKVTGTLKVIRVMT